MEHTTLRSLRWAPMVLGALAWPAWSQGTPAASAETDELEALLNQPVYAASKYSQDAAAAPAAATVLTAGDIRAYGWRTLAEILKGVRGVYTRSDHFYTYLGVRGFARPGDYSSRLLVLIDGMRVNDNIYDQAGIGREFPLDVALIERVEFIPGPGSALYGSNAVLGVVNIITKSSSALSARTASVELGSMSSRLLSLTQGFEWGSGHGVLAAKAEVRPGRDRYFAEFDSAATNFGLATNADREMDQKLYGKWSQGDLTVAALLSERRKQIPTGAFGTDFPSQETRAGDRYGFADLQWQPEVGAGQKFYLRATLAQYDFKGRFDYRSTDGIQDLDQQGRWLSAETRWLYDGWRGHRVVLGLEGQRNLMQRQRSRLDGSAGSTLADVETSSSRWGVFGNDEITLSPGVRAVLGARLDRQLSGEQSTTPRLALLWDAAPGLTVKYLDGRAYREPNAYESQYQDITAMANPELRSETLHARELALDWRALSNLRLAASLYRYRVNDLIEQQTDASSGLLIFTNAGSVRASGVELEADYVGASGWRARASWANQRTRTDALAEQLGNSPRSLTKLNLSVPVSALQSRLGFEWQRLGERVTLLGEKLPPHATSNLTLQASPPGSRLSVSASVYNLFDKAYADPGGPELRQDTVVQDGRQWRVQLSMRY